MARKLRKNIETVSEKSLETKIYNTAIYARLSIEDSGKNDSSTIENQLELLERYVKNHPELCLKYTFIDNGESGTSFHRPSWIEMLNACKNGEIDCCVFKDLSRIGRIYIETGEYLEKIFPLLGVRIIAINDHYDNQNLTNNGQLITNLKNLVNDMYSKDISKKIATVFRMKQKNGDFVGTYASYGYLKDPENKNKIIVDNETAPIVKQIFEWKSEGMGSTQICRKLAEKNVPSPSKYRYEKGIVKCQKYENSRWSVKVIKQIICSEVYLGNMVQGRKQGALYEDGGSHKMVDKSLWTIVKGTHEPIISQELWDKANAVLSQRTAEYYEKQGKYSQFENPELVLKNLVFCADCGKPLYRYRNIKKDKIHLTYRCSNHDILMNCPIKSIEESQLYNAVFEAIKAQILLCCDIKKIISDLNKNANHKSKFSDFDSEIENIQLEIKRIQNLKQAVFEDFSDKLLTSDEYKFAIKKYNSETEKLQINLKKAKSEKKKYTQSSTSQNKCLTSFMQFSNDKKISREMAIALIEKIEISDKNKVHITFKFRDEFGEILRFSEGEK
jgi:DNA invertase Pin-like site-specific DNA recombinase